jgi:hypothetical protein
VGTLTGPSYGLGLSQTPSPTPIMRFPPNSRTLIFSPTSFLLQSFLVASPLPGSSDRQGYPKLRSELNSVNARLCFDQYQIDEIKMNEGRLTMASSCEISHGSIPGLVSLVSPENSAASNPERVVHTFHTRACTNCVRAKAKCSINIDNKLQCER